LGADPSNRASVTVSEEVLGLGVLEERVLLPIQPLLDVDQKWWNPVGLITIEPPRQLDERVQLASGLYGPDLDCHAARTLYSAIDRAVTACAWACCA
jgi:hypothetical protein